MQLVFGVKMNGVFRHAPLGSVVHVSVSRAALGRLALFLLTDTCIGLGVSLDTWTVGRCQLRRRQPPTIHGTAGLGAGGGHLCA
jgi:hypothetical protein